MHRKHWMHRKARRKNRGVVPDNEALLDQFRTSGRCEWCGLRYQVREAAHVFGKGIGGPTRMDVRINLVSLCRTCHQSSHDGNRPLTIDLLAVVAAREGTTQDAIRDALNCLKWGRSP